ncbi:MAG: polysaccharide biosynthesis protein [Phycisphaerae bacterium]|nr:polysaccharide biosynthesis protein [Phycisphaerae bacterium]
MGIGLLQKIKLLNRRAKMSIAMALDMVVASFALWLTYAVQELTLLPSAITEHWWLLPLASVATVSVFYVFRQYHTVIRFAGSRFFLNTLIASFLTAWIVGVAFLFEIYGSGGVPAAIFVTYPFYLMGGTAGSRLLARRVLEIQVTPKEEKIISVIYGSGSGGTQLFSAIRYGGIYKPVAFLDDDRSKHGQSVHGLRVYAPKKLPALMKSSGVSTVLLALPSTDPIRRAEIVKELKAFGVKKIETMPSFSELVTKQATFGDLRTLSIEDILTRTEVRTDEELAEKCVLGKSVMVTGAGGSIGSELCRQIIKRKPKTVVLFDNAESSLFYIEREINQRISKTNDKTQVVAVLGSVTDESRLREILNEYKVESVFHAAAYKHVSMLEKNQLEGARNNIIGTRCVFDAAAWAKCSSLVVVSTDKAVQPTSFMGATKRFAELVVQAKAQSNTKMKTCLVRFGNVLGSSGSVVPIFQEQIQSGGPVTVTNPEATRYFMTIPEASQLILQAGAMGTEANVFMLQMGEPIRILDLAKRMIALAGYTVKNEENPKGDIEITFKGLLPGEKLHEQLVHGDKLDATQHKMILVSKEELPEQSAVLHVSSKIEEAIANGDVVEILVAMKQLIPDFIPSWESVSTPIVETPESNQSSAKEEKIQ